MSKILRLFIKSALFTVIFIQIASAETYLAIDYFPIKTLNDITPVNAVLRTSKSAIVCEDTRNTDQYCEPEWRTYIEECSEWFLNSNSQHQYIARISKTKEFAVISDVNEGGNGGAKKYWNLFYIYQDDNKHASCPSNYPQLSGVELSEGGKVWYDLTCNKNEAFENCAQRIFYPKSNASRLEFTSLGKSFKRVPMNPKIPPNYLN